jgi:flagellar basal-body rod protein FlgB
MIPPALVRMTIKGALIVTSSARNTADRHGAIAVDPMDLSKLPLFDMMQRKLSWLSARQQVLSQNIANADTPGYKPRDLKPLDFKNMAKGQIDPVAPTVTNPMHLVGFTPEAPGTKSDKEKHPLETTISGNAVTMEEELMKANRTASDFELTTNLYHKQLSMIKEALGHN